MQQEEMEIQLWEYIDGTCSHDERVRISQLINTDELWKQKHAELTAFDTKMHTELGPATTAPGFAAQVMGGINPVTTGRNKAALNISIKAVACFFIVITVVSLGYVLFNTDWNFKQPGTTPALKFTVPTVNLNLPEHTAAVAGFAAILLLLLAVDTILRKKTISNL